MNIKENTEKKRFEAIDFDPLPFIEYIRAKGAVYLTHTDVPKSLEGEGIGSAMVESVLGKLKNEGVKIAPLCPFVASFIRKNPEYKDLVASGYHV